MNPAVKRLLDRQQAAGFGKLKFGNGTTASFQKGRLLTDMTSTEANAFLMEIGSKVTGFQGLDVTVEQFKREMAEHGAWAVLKHIFPQSFVKKLARVDQDLAGFFQSNPILADYWRIKKSGELSSNSALIWPASAASP